MVLESLLIKVKKTISHTKNYGHVNPPPKSSIIKRSRIGVLAFEIAGIMPKITHMWRFLSDENINHFRKELMSLEGVFKIVSKKESLLLGLACAELVENVRILAKTVARLSRRCEDSSLGCFETVFDVFANTGHDPYGWVSSLKDMEVKIKKMERYVMDTAALYREMDELTIIQNTTSIFTILSRIKLIFGINNEYPPTSIPRSLSASAMVYPSNQTTNPWKTVSKSAKHLDKNDISHGFFETNSKILTPSSNTLGYAGLSLHYANLIIVMEKMIRSPQLVGLDARDDLYSMLPNSIRWSLRGRLKGIGFRASDPALAGEWREALGKILGWLSPLAHNMIKWQSERSFEHQNRVAKTNVLLVQTLFFAKQEKTEAAISELLVGLNYIWRFEREMNAKAFNLFKNVDDHTVN
ncbi:hypothetical protein CTI12_AA153850 [Artemisia annua]|uniref:DUF668 domain-containing protein n=1 Tax=Artemisia annua TaxID=35608 RepID=A0A2U1PH73_ARTAN|nr:hypothetical protein CTI12_AA153850 [Artemisia annua]